MATVCGYLYSLPTKSNESFSLLQNKIDRPVLDVLPNLVILNMVDGITLRNNIRPSIQIFDYSVIIAPLFKALEGTMIFIAEQLNLKLDKPWGGLVRL